jgi:hypothetical protein
LSIQNKRLKNLKTVDLTIAQDVPPRVMYLLRIFLAASSRGKEAVLTLEISKKAIPTKYRSVEPQQPPKHNFAKKKNPARARRSRLRWGNIRKGRSET